MDIGSWGLRAMRGVGMGMATVMAGLLASCGGGVPEGNEHVEYDGTTPIVEGASYERDTTAEQNEPCTPSIILIPDSGRGGVSARAAERYGLELVGFTGYGEAVIKVPEGYEFQWLKAFRSEALGERIGGREKRLEPRKLTLTAAGKVVQDDVPAEAVAKAKVDDTNVPRDPPSDDDVRRLLFDRYGVLEKADGMPATETASEQQLLLRAHLFSVSNSGMQVLLVVVLLLMALSIFAGVAGAFRMRQRCCCFSGSSNSDQGPLKIVDPPAEKPVGIELPLAW